MPVTLVRSILLQLHVQVKHFCKGPGRQATELLDACLSRRAKEKRERLRSAHLAPDYIPLATASVLEAPEAGGAAPARDDSDEDAEAEVCISERALLCLNNRSCAARVSWRWHVCLLEAFLQYLGDMPCLYKCA